MKIHNDFRLNGNSYTVEELKEVAYSLIKEGEPFELKIGDFLIDWLDGKPTVEVLTSGSTGAPKKIKLRKKNMVNSAKATGLFFNLVPKNKALLCLPADYIAGKMMLVRAMVLGLELDCVTPSSNPLQPEAGQYDFCAMVPLQAENSVGALSKVKILIVGGAPVSIEQKAKFQAQIVKTEIFETYGMTETITHIALKRISPASSEKQNFKTLPDVKISIDKRDCLIIHAPLIAEGPIVTNDIVKLESDTEFKWLGRFDNVINSGGVKLFPEQIEAKLAPLIQQRFFVSGLQDDTLGQRLVLIVEGDANTNQLLGQVKMLKSLQKFEIPKEVLTISEFQETGSGKILRDATTSMLLA